jgi:hypothetical protein
MLVVRSVLMTFALALGACGNSFSAAPADASTGAGGTAGSTGSGPVTLASPPVSAGQASNGFLALDATTVYFTYQGSVAGGVAKTPKAGPGGVTCLACNAGGPRGITVDSAFVYWTDTVLQEVRREQIAGGAPQTLWQGVVGTPVAVDPSSVYWFDAGAQQLMRADLAGGALTVAAASQANVGSISADRGVLFWTTDSAVMALDLASGPSLTVLASGRNAPKSVAVDATHAYWTEGQWDQPDNSIQRVPRTGGSPEAITTPGAASGFRIALDATHVYVADNYGRTVWRVPKTGGSPEVLAASQPYPFDIAVDALAVYWTSETSAELFRLAK